MRFDNHHEPTQDLGEEISPVGLEENEGPTLPSDPHTSGFRINHRFEPVVWMDVICLLIAVAISAVIGIFVPEYGLRDLSLFYSRTVVGLIGGVVGLCCSYALFRIGRHFFDQAIWATIIIASSHVESESDRQLSLSKVDGWLSEVGPISGLQVLYHRLFGQSGIRNDRWALVAFFFPFALYLGTVQAFIHARTVILVPFVQQQNTTYEPIQVLGALTEQDLFSAAQLSSPLQDLERGWSFQSLADPLVPKSLKLSDPINPALPVYVTDAYPSLVDQTGVGYGAFNLSQLSASNTFKTKNLFENDVWSSSGPRIQSVPSVIYWPRWGQKIRCQLLSDLLETNLIERSLNNQTFIFIPETFVQALFDNMTEAMPAQLSDRTYGFDVGQDSIGYDLAINQTSISLTAAFAYDGVAMSTSSAFLEPDVSSNKLITIDTFLVRLNQTFAPNGVFPRIGTDGLGYDGAVCASIISPYLISTFNSSSGLQTLSIISSGIEPPSFGERLGDSVGGTDGNLLTLNASTSKFMHQAAGNNSRMELRKANSRDAAFIPNPTLIALTSGRVGLNLGPADRYASLDSKKLQDLIGLIDSRFSLPYFVGRGKIQAYKFEGVEKAYADVLVPWLLGSLGLVLFTGLVGCFFCPVLPLSLPHRETSLSAFHPLLQKIPPQQPDSADLAVALASIAATGTGRDDGFHKEFQALRRR